MTKILIVEDERRFREILKDYFEVENYTVYEASNGIEALDIFNKEDIDLMVLDIMMPELDGFSVCRKVRSKSDIPIIIMTARSEEDDQLYGYDLGADDYVIKPFSPKVFVAKVKQLLKRNKPIHQREEEQEQDIMRVEDITVYLSSHKVTVGEKKVELAPKEYDILVYLMKNENAVITRQQLLNEIWGYDFFGDDRVIDTHIKKIRKKLGEQSKHIQTVISVGYKFEVAK